MNKFQAETGPRGVSFPSSDRTSRTRNWHCVLCQAPPPAAGTSACRLQSSFVMACGWQFCVLEAARQSKPAVDTVELLHRLPPRRRGPFVQSPTQLAIEFAELLVEVAVTGWSRHFSQSLRSALAVSGVPPSWPTTIACQRGSCLSAVCCCAISSGPAVRGYLAVLAKHRSPRSLPRGCGKQVNEL